MKNLCFLFLFLLTTLTYAQEEIFKVVDEMPRFPGCEHIDGDAEAKRLCANEKLLQYIYTNLKYPEVAKANEVEGMVVIQFVIDTDGSIGEAKIVRDIGADCGKAALQIVQDMNTYESNDTIIVFNDATYEEEVRIEHHNAIWRPGYQDGKPVKVLYTLPVRYKLSDDEVSHSEDIQEATNVERTIDNDTTEEIFKVVEEMPRFPGCEDMEGSASDIENCAKNKMLQYIYENINYPAAAREKGVEGVVVIQFLIDTDGSIDEATIVRDIGGGCGHAALSVVNKMNNISLQDTIVIVNDVYHEETMKIVNADYKWRPGYQRGKAVKVLYTLPVKFKLANDDNSETQENFTPIDESLQVVIPAMVRKAYSADPVHSSQVVGDIVSYGRTIHPILKVPASHTGIDFRAVPGVAVSAAGNGTVIFAGDDGSKYGNYVVVKHDDRTTSLYGHLSEIKVNEGQQLTIGDLLGKVGQSGKASYPHLHFEVRIDDIPVNPRRWELFDTDSVNSDLAEYNNALRKPIYVVDGETQEIGFTILDASFNMDDIETMDFYEGEKAREKFGFGAGNGVVDIHLKSETILPEPQFELEQNRPNPVGDATTIGFHLPTNQLAALYFYDSQGRHIHTVNDGFQLGYNEVIVRKDELNTTGLVYYFLVQGDFTKTMKMVVQ